MQQQNFNTSLIRKIRREPVDCPVLEKEQLFNTCFSQYAGRNKEIPAIISAVASTLVQSPIRNQLLIRLKREYIPGGSRLSELVEKLLCIFAASMQDEPCTAAYYNKLTPNLRYFLLLVNTIQEKIQRLLKKLTSGEVIYSEDVNDFRDNMEHCMDELEDCYDVYSYFLQTGIKDDANNSKSPVRLTSQVEQYFVKLVDLVEVSILNTQNILANLQAWHTQLATQEKEEMYN